MKSKVISLLNINLRTNIVKSWKRILWNLGSIILIIILFSGCSLLFDGESYIGIDPIPHTEYYNPVLHPNEEIIAYYWMKLDSFSRDFTQYDSDSTGIWFYDRSNNTNNFVHLTNFPWQIEFSFSGDKFYYAQSSIFITDISGVNTKIISEQSGFWSLSISPDGTYLTIVDSDNNIYIMRSDGTEIKKIRSENEDVRGFQPNLFPGNDRIIFNEAGRRVVVIDTSGDNKTTLFEGDPSLSRVRVSPSGELVMFNYKNKFYTMNSDGTNVNIIKKYSIGDASWSKDGDQIIFTGRASNPEYTGQNSIWIMDKDGLNSHQILP